MPLEPNDGTTARVSKAAGIEGVWVDRMSLTAS